MLAFAAYVTRSARTSTSPPYGRLPQPRRPVRMNARAHRRLPSPTLSSSTSPRNVGDPVHHRLRPPLRR
eukprot:3589853-Pleurochrysis_carterae.AAC.1